MAPLAVAVAAFGVTFGVLAQKAGIGSFAALLFSAATFAGSAQFAAASVLSVAPALHGPWWQRLLRAQVVVDESWAVSHIGGGRYDRRLLLGAGATLYCAWVAGTAAGVAFGSLLGDPAKLGLDAAFPALFLALLAGQLRDRRAVVAALLGGAIALVLMPFVPPGIPIVAASAACLIGLGRRGAAS